MYGKNGLERSLQTLATRESNRGFAERPAVEHETQRYGRLRGRALIV